MEKLYMEYLNQKERTSQEVIKAHGAYEEALENYVETIQEYEFHNTAEFLQKSSRVEPHNGASVIDNRHSFYMELEEIQYKYECLTSLTGILQQFVAEQVDIAGAPEDSLNNALYEIENGMLETNERFKALIIQKGGIS